MNLVPNEQLLLNVPFQSTKYRKKDLCVEKKVRETIGDVYCPTCRNEKCVYISTKKTTNSYDSKNAKPAATFLVFLLRTKNQQLGCLALMEHIVLPERRVVITKKKNHLHFWRNFSANHSQAHPNLTQKRTNWVQIWNKRIHFLLADDLSDIFIFPIIFFNFNLQSTATQLTFNLQKIKIFSVSNDGIQWTLDFGRDSVTVAVKYLDQTIKISSQEIPLAAWQLLLSQRQDFRNDHLPRVPITQNHEGTMEMRDEVLSSMGAQDLDTSSYQVSDLEDIEFNWENSQLDMDAVFRPGVDTPFLQLYLTIYRRRDQLKTPLGWTKRKTRRMLLHQHPSLSDPRNIPGCREVALLEQE